MASSGPSLDQGNQELDAIGSACVNEGGKASAGGDKDVAANSHAAAASSMTNSPKPSTSRAITSTSASSKNVVYDLVSVENSSQDSPAKLSTSEDSSMRECVSADSLLADLGINNLLPGQYESDSTDTPLISLSPYKVAGSMDLCDSDKCSGSDNNVRDLESLLKEAGIEEIKDEVVIVSKTSSGLDMIQVLDEDLMSDDLLNDGKVLTVKADIECIPSNTVLLSDTPQDTPEHKTDCSKQENTSLASPNHTETSHAQDDTPQTQNTYKKSNGISKKDVKQQPKGKKPKLQKQLQFSDEESESDNYRNLKIIPRTTQYEKHPLLQTKHESGLSTIEALLLEHEEKLKKSERLKKHKSLSIEDRDLSHKRQSFEANRRKSVESYSQMKFVPRTTQYERHPLLEKTESGLSELEQYLKEKEEELMRQEHGKRHSEGSIHDSHKAATRKVSFPNVPDKRPSLGALTPRTSQYEKHPLLQSRDEETGLSEIEKFLQEKHLASMQEDEDTDKEMGNSTTKPNEEKSALLCEDPQPRTASIKRVHFEKSGKGTSEEIEELGSVQINPDDKANSSHVQENNADKKKKTDNTVNVKDGNKCCIIL